MSKHDNHIKIYSDYIEYYKESMTKTGKFLDYLEEDKNPSETRKDLIKAHYELIESDRVRIQRLQEDVKEFIRLNRVADNENMENGIICGN